AGAGDDVVAAVVRYRGAGAGDATGTGTGGGTWAWRYRPAGPGASALVAYAAHQKPADRIWHGRHWPGEPGLGGIRGVGRTRIHLSLSWHEHPADHPGRMLAGTTLCTHGTRRMVAG